MKSHAEFSTCQKYRYALWRTWDEDKKKVMFIGLNPSIADETKDDRTIKHCINYAKQWGYGGIIMGNLFAYRTPMPDKMMQSKDPVGPENDTWLIKLSKQADIIVGIWGNSGNFLNRSIEVIKLFPNLLCLQITMSGQPHHTRGLPDGIKPVPYNCK